MTGIIAARFLLLGIIGWVAAIVLGTGARFELWSWRSRWSLAGVLAGLGTWGLFVYSNVRAFLVAGPMGGPLLALTAVLFVGCGLAVSYAGLFGRLDPARPLLPPGSPDERLWLQDAVDRLRPQRLDWWLTGALGLPGIGLAVLGATQLGLTAPVVIGLASLAGPLYAAVGLMLRRREARRLETEIETGRALEAGDAGHHEPTAFQEATG